MFKLLHVDGSNSSASQGDIRTYYLDHEILPRLLRRSCDPEICLLRTSFSMDVYIPLKAARDNFALFIQGLSGKGRREEIQGGGCSIY
jgi:hypothetical protein